MIIENIFLNSFHLRGSDYRKLQQLIQLYWKRLKNFEKNDVIKWLSKTFF